MDANAAADLAEMVGITDSTLLRYSTDHQVSARAVNLGKNWVKKKSALKFTAHLEEMAEKKKSLLRTLTAHQSHF